MVLSRLKFSAVSLIPFIYLLGAWSYAAGPNLVMLNECSQLSTVMWYSGVSLTTLSFWAVNQRSTVSAAQLWAYICFIPLVYLFISTSNLLTFFMCYELFLLPSFLIVFFGSPNRRGVLASLYFLMWTQVGSFLVFVAIVLVFVSANTFSFSALTSAPSLAILLALAGFGIKVPAWPAHYWLTKTHVEAPTYFSIYLSGFLVKTALYGVWLFSNTGTLYSQSLIIAVASIGVIDASLKMWAQVDLKKLVAYGTVQEMNLILIGFSLGTASAVKATSLFILAHTILSTMFFLLSDSLYRRFGARNTSSVRGVLQTAPTLGYTIFVCCLLFAGLPFTLKFLVEVYIFAQLFATNVGALVCVLFICNWFGIVSFMKGWYGVLFGSSSTSCADSTPRELFIYTALAGLLILLGWVSVCII